MLFKLLAKLFQLALDFYRIFLSPLLHLIVGAGFGCRFEPTCSHYATEALDIHGPLHGSLLAVKRIGRCNPFCRAGYDPVPRAIAKPCTNYY